MLTGSFVAIRWSDKELMRITHQLLDMSADTAADNTAQFSTKATVQLNTEMSINRGRKEGSEHRHV